MVVVLQKEEQLIQVVVEEQNLRDHFHQQETQHQHTQEEAELY